MAPRRIAAALAAAFLCACAGAMTMKKPVQGLAGTFTTYGPPEVLANCTPLKTQFQKDSCRHENERVVEEPYQGTLIIRNLDTRVKIEQPLDAQGSYRAVLDPGPYEVCVNGECSDPIDVRMGAFATYGQRLPRKPAAGKAKPKADTPAAAR